MTTGRRFGFGPLACVVAAAALLAAPAGAGAAAGGTSPGESVPAAKRPKPKAKKPAAGPKVRVIKGVLITQYYPAPERWFVGRRVYAPGMVGRHRIDWLYSARGLPMEGDGTDLSGRPWHFVSSNAGGWVDRKGRSSGANGSHWLDAMYWLSSAGVTFPLDSGGWSNGRPKGKGLPARTGRGTRFAAGQSRPLHYWQSVAVDPSVIPLGSVVHVPAYRSKPGAGYMCAQDVGGAIGGRHIDVWRPAPKVPDGGDLMRGQTIRVIPPPTARLILPFCR